MNLYVESSAILAWLLDEPQATRVREPLTTAKVVISSVLALVECDRALHRVVKEERLTETDAADKRAGLARAASHWTTLSLSPRRSWIGHGSLSSTNPCGLWTRFISRVRW